MSLSGRVVEWVWSGLQQQIEKLVQTHSLNRSNGRKKGQMATTRG